MEYLSTLPAYGLLVKRRVLHIKPSSGNAPYFIILHCLTPDDFTCQGVLLHSMDQTRFCNLSNKYTGVLFFYAPLGGGGCWGEGLIHFLVVLNPVC
jgi:hypothetical protein